MRVVSIVFVSSLLNMVAHAVLSPMETSHQPTVNPSVFVKNGVLVPAVIVWELMAFSVLALVYISIQDNLNGKRWVKGLLYGLSFGGLYFIGMFEAVLLLSSNAQTELLMGLTDCATFVLSGALLGLMVGTDSADSPKKQNAWAILVIGIFYTVGRYFAYSVMHVQSAINTKPLGTLIWTISQGLWVGIIYQMLQSGTKGKSVITQSVFFGVVIFGLNWLMNHLFMYVIIEFTLDLLVRVATDVLSTILGIIAFKTLSALGDRSNNMGAQI